MTITALVVASLVISFLALVASVASIEFARRTRCQSPKAPTREEKIARARGAIEACRGAEMLLAEHTSDLPAAIILASHRASAAHARQELRTLGVEA